MISSRWSLRLLFAAVALGSLAMLVVHHREGRRSLETTVSVVDNLSQARMRVAEALLLAERLGSGDPTVSPAAPLAVLEEARALLDDLLRGRSSLLGVAAEPLAGSRWSALVEEYRENLRRLGEDIDSGRYAELDAVSRQQRISAERQAAAALEREAHVRLRDELAGAERAFRLRAAVWVLALVGSGVAFLVIGRSRDRAEEARARAERRYAALAEHAAAGLVRTGGDGQVLEATEWFPRFFAGGSEAWEGRPWWAWLEPSEAERVEAIWRARAARATQFLLEAKHRDTEGELRWITARWARDPGAGDGEETWIGTLIEKTEVRRVEDQLRQSQKMEAVGRLSAGIAHDFNNLLTVVSTNAELLAGSPGVSGEAQELVDEVAGAAESGRSLVRSLMGFSREMPLEIRPLDLGAAVDEAARLASRLLPSGVELVVDVPESGPAVHADRSAVQQILLNLVSNAADAMPDGGRIGIQVELVEVDEAYRDTHPWVDVGRFGRILVSDSGTGMDSATLERIFDPFFTTKEEGEGTGLGLSTVHGLVRQHGGHIHVYSRPGAGTTFRLYLPTEEGAAAEGTAPDQAQAQDQRAQASRARLHILVVDDNPQLLRTAERLLTRLGHTVSVAESGARAMELLQDGTSADIVISDMDMEGMDGLELLGALRESGDARPFILTSGHPEASLAPSDAAFLAKPWTVEELSRAIEEAEVA